MGTCISAPIAWPVHQRASAKSRHDDGHSQLVEQQEKPAADTLAQGRRDPSLQENDVQRSPGCPDGATQHPDGRQKLQSTKEQAVQDLRQFLEEKQMIVFPVQDLLTDLKLVRILGSGGFSTVYEGLWRNNTLCAVKVFATPVANPDQVGSSHMLSSSSISCTNQDLLQALPLQVAAETLLSKDLSHPNVVQTYVVRCALLTPEFEQAVAAAKEAVASGKGRTLLAQATHTTQAAAPGAPTAAEVSTSAPAASASEQLRATNAALMAHINQRALHNSGGSSQAESRRPRSTNTGMLRTMLSMGHEQRVACILSEFGGITPLVPGWGSFNSDSDKGGNVTPRAGNADENSALGTVDSLGSDGWAVNDKGRALSWMELLGTLGAKAGDCITVMVMAHATLGTLWEPIKMGVFQPSGCGSFSLHMRLRALLRTAREVATGLQHLHDCGVVHGDIKPANILLKDSRGDKRGFSAMVSDFGLSHIINDRSLKAGSRPSGTLQYMAPELLTKTHYSRASDMYAFGVMLCEMASGQVAYKGMKQGEVIQQVQRGNRPPWPEHTFPGMRELYVRCTAHNPVDRPTATELVEELGRLEAAVRAQAHADKRQANEAAQAWPAAARAEEQESGRAAAVAMAGMGSSAVGGSAATCRAGSSAAASSAAAAQHASPAQRSGRGGDMQVQVSKSGSSGSVIIRPIEISVSF